MTIINTKGGTYKYLLHKHILFNFPKVVPTTIANKSNWSFDGAVIHEAVMEQDSDEGLDDDEGEAEEVEYKGHIGKDVQVENYITTLILPTTFIWDEGLILLSPYNLW